MLPFRRRRARRRGFLFGRAIGRRQAPAPGESNHPDHTTELSRLADLHERGALSDEEFEREKRRILEH